ncbi:MAG: AgmX/PglI C-terminal domain-containing protein [bacterium]|nr:AgmX/PglI C-terminal domain-containing protein [bacterium]
MTTAQPDIQCYQQPLWGTLDRVSRNCLIAAAAWGVIVIFAVFVAPQPIPHEITIDQMPERFARLILEKPKPVPAVKTPTPSTTYEAPPEIARAPEPETITPRPAKPRVRPVERRQPPKVAQDKGQQGRSKAQTEVAENLAEVSGSLDKVLGELSQALPVSQSEEQPRRKSTRRPRRGVRTGRASTQLAAVNGITDLSQADVRGSSLEGSSISIATITDLKTGAGVAGGGDLSGRPAGDNTSGGGEIRSSEALLAVVRRYAPGVQFCYENELQKSPGLRGKLVVSLTVEPDGTVSNVVLVEDSLRSAAVSDCVTAQMRGWKFPGVESGNVTFKTPFVFTPPE